MQYGTPDGVILLNDFAGVERKSCFWVTRSRLQGEFFAALYGLRATRSSELVEARCVRQL
jgi:hypothetical protein